jgi:hypothetical protein
MDQPPNSTQVVSSKVKILRQTSIYGAVLLLLSGLVWPGLALDRITAYDLALALLLLALWSSIDPSLKLRHPKNLAIVVFISILLGANATFLLWREGKVVAEAKFDPGIAPFELTVRQVPVPVTQSRHFIVTLKRGQYPVTSFRYFWIEYTPQKVRIEWTRLETFKVIFDEKYVATCNWSWGNEATWTMQVPPGAQGPGEKP